MTKPNLGKKRTCQSCEARFFDLNKNPAICPKCGAKYKIPLTKARKTSQTNTKVKNVIASEINPIAENAKEENFTTELNNEDLELDTGVLDNENDNLESELDDDLDDSLMENTSDLNEDNDELSEVFENVTNDDTDKH